MTLARNTDPETSHAAAASVDNLRDSQQQVLDAFKEQGAMTDEQLVTYLYYAAIRMSPSGIRTRRKELVDKGLIRDTGDRAPMSTGRLAILWEAT